MFLKVLTNISRFIVAVLFIFSGFVKLVDPIGSQYKFEEYFSADVLNLEFLIPYALPFSILLIITEITLGVMLLIGYKRKFTVRSLFFLTLIFLFLTWYSAYYNKVTDCGCFGDAVKLSTWETFYKNVILIGLIIFLIIRVKDIKPLFSKKIGAAITYLSVFSFLYITYHVLTHLPIVDFRPYAIGKNITEGMRYKGDGKIPPIHDFTLEGVDGDLTNELLAKDKLMLVVVYDLDKAATEGFAKVKRLADQAIIKGYTVYGVSASFEDDLVLAQNKYDLPFEFLFCDQTTLKTIIRANPGIVILNKGTVTGKWSWNDADDIKL
ncbi:BT_3928 family protein [Tenacibaculum sp. UWU-22]|uniref:BT_3928 family protein n=1 Tax=Tenacibaculum sp. UWU-22 TaxID=3234187 RepID=UPI0034DB1960